MVFLLGNHEFRARPAGEAGAILSRYLFFCGILFLRFSKRVLGRASSGKAVAPEEFPEGEEALHDSVRSNGPPSIVPYM